MKKFLSLILVVALIAAMAIPAMAETITITRDGSYDSSASGDRVYTWYQAFRVTYETSSSTGGGVENGVPGDVTATPEKGYSYYLDAANDAAIIAKYGDSNPYFKLTASADGSQYIVEWKDGVATTAANLQAAANWIIENEAYVATGTLTADGAKWTADVQKGYYVIKGSEGANLVAVTTDVNIAEKNSYPTVSKVQKDEDATAYADSKVDVAIGDVIEYQITVHVPADANQDIVLTDTMTPGIEYDTTASLTVTGYTAETDYVIGTESATGYVLNIKATDATKGKDIVVTYKAKVVAAALTDIESTGRRNTIELKYGGDHYVMTDYVEFTTYYAGVLKIDGDNANKKLANVEFTLKEGDAEFKVSLVDGVYVPDENGSSTVKTDANGQIIIRGLDKDKTYTLTETKTNAGYNLLAEPATLSLVEDKEATVTAGSDTFDKVENFQGTVLPSTGGHGVYWFYGIGGALIVGAVVLLITKKRMSKEQ